MMIIKNHLKIWNSLSVIISTLSISNYSMKVPFYKIDNAYSQKQKKREKGEEKNKADENKLHAVRRIILHSLNIDNAKAITPYNFLFKFQLRGN